MKNYIIITITALLALFMSCDKSILGHEPSADNPEEIFETLWQDFDEHYPLFGVRNVNWDSLYTVYRPMVTKDISQDSLWGVCTSMMSHFNDRHTSIWQIDGDKKSFNTGIHLVSDAYMEFTHPAIMDELEANSIERPHHHMLYGKVANKSIGYLHLAAMRDYKLNDLNTAIEAVTQYNSMILDLRLNRGGTSSYRMAALSWLSDNDDVYSFQQSRSGPNHDDFNPKYPVYNIKSDNPYNGQIVVLTDRATVSAGEWVLLSLKTCDNVTQIGDTTSGCLSTVSMHRYLPNGWVYRYSMELITMPDGSTLESVGIAPDIYIRNDNYTIIGANQEDAVLKKAIDFLSN